MNIKYDQYKSVITFKKLSLPFLHFICFQTSRLLPLYKRSSTSIPAPSKGYISTTSILRNIQKDAIIMLCTECVLSSLIWMVYRKKNEVVFFILPIICKFLTISFTTQVVHFLILSSL